MRLFDYRTILSVAILLIVGCSKTTDVDLPITSTSEGNNIALNLANDLLKKYKSILSQY